MNVVIHPGTRATSAGRTLGAGPAATNGVVPRGMPASMSRDEVFFWELDWQAGERESAQARAADETVAFDSPTDLLKWLLSDD